MTAFVVDSLTAALDKIAADLVSQNETIDDLNEAQEIAGDLLQEQLEQRVAIALEKAANS